MSLLDDAIQCFGDKHAPVMLPSYIDSEVKGLVACPIGAAMQEAVPVNIQNVADYFFEQTNVGSWRTWRDFPNIAPPWPYAWYEYRMPSVWHRQRDTRPCGRAGMKVGLFVIASEDPQHEAGWHLLVWMFTQPFRNNHQQWLSPIPYYWLRVDADGSPNPEVVTYNDADGQTAYKVWAGAVDANTGHPVDTTAPGVLDEIHYLAMAMKPALLAMTFTHCHNVEVRTEPTRPRLDRAHQRRGHPPSVAYHTLQIAQATAYIEQERRSGASAPQALHITRGHFADYREGRGLFGRHHVLVW